MTPEQKQQMMEAVDRYFEEEPVFNPDISLFPGQHSHFEVMTIPEEDLKVGDRVLSIGIPQIYIGTVTKVYPTTFYVVDQEGLTTGYAIRSDRQILVEREILDQL